MTRTQRVAIGRAQILEDVYRGEFVAEDIQNFEDLHEYVDANKYGGFLDDHVQLVKDWQRVQREVQDQLHTWIVNGGLADLQEWDEHHALNLSRSR